MSSDFQNLTPDLVLDAIEALGFHCNGQLIELNSYENRVFQIGLDEGEPLITKFYRPNRWTDEQILEEHEFTQELVDNEITVVPALKLASKSEKDDMSDELKTLHLFGGYRYTLYTRYGGRSPNVDDLRCLEILGQYIGRIHMIGSRTRFKHRLSYSIEEFGYDSREFLLKNRFIPADLEAAYESITDILLQQISVVMARCEQLPLIRLHGDCHMGNVLWREETPHFVDFDDARNGLPIQDLWMLLSGDREQQTLQMQKILSGYEQFFSFNLSQVQLIEPLRTLRMMYFSAWIARRWEDPAFPRAFTWFNTERYWAEHILELKEQASKVQEPSLELFI